MLFNTLMRETITAPGSGSPALVPASSVPVMLRLISTQLGGVSPVVEVRFVREDGQEALSMVSLVGTGTRTVVLPSSTAVRVMTRCIVGASTFVVEQSMSSGEVQADGIESDFQAVDAVGAQTIIDLDKGYNIDLNLGFSTTLILCNPRSGERYVFWVTQGGGFTITWPGNVIWSPAIAPVTAAAASVDIFTIMYKKTGNLFAGSYIQDLV
jgi:hypothetical protein